VIPIPPGEAQIVSGAAYYQGNTYTYKQSVAAQVEYVVGEFYWKVAVGESTQATEYAGPGGLVSVEQDHNEMNVSFCYPMTGEELAEAFRIAPPPTPAVFTSSSSGTSWITWLVILFAIGTCDDDDDGYSPGGSSGVYVGPGYSGK
jgi:hypothetical protein